MKLHKENVFLTIEDEALIAQLQAEGYVEVKEEKEEKKSSKK